jgi:hypothetical protein
MIRVQRMCLNFRDVTYTPPQHLARCAHYIVGYRNHIQTGPMIVEGPTKLRVQKQNPPAGSALPKENRARDPTSSSFVSKSWPGGFLHIHPCGLASSRLGFHERDYQGKSLEITKPGFASGDISPCLVLWRGTCHCWLSSVHGDPDST